jgi:hypothetical protein
MYFDLNIGNTFSPNDAQWGQLIDAYSVIITGAFTDPSAMSGSETGFATRAAAASCALASLFGCSGAKAKSAASVRTVAKARRVTIN